MSLFSFECSNCLCFVKGDSAGGHLTAALAFRWRRQVIAKQRAGQLVEQLPPIRLQVLFYPVLQFVNVSTTSYLLRRYDVLNKKSMVWFWTLFLFGNRFYDINLLASLWANNQTTKRTRKQLADLFDFGDDYSVVTAAQRAAAASIRESDPKECDPEGDPAVESLVLPIALHEEASPLLAKSLHDLPPAYVVSCELDVLRDEALLYVKRMRNAKPPIAVEHRHYNEQHGALSPGGKIFSDLVDYLRHNSTML